MNKSKTKLATKDLIVAGAFAALYVVLLFVCVSALGFIPVTYLLAPMILSVILGPVYMLYVTKVPKQGAILILAALVGLVTSMGGLWVSLIWSLAIGIAAELIARAGKYRSRNLYLVSYCVFACTHMSPFWTLIVSKQSFLDSCVSYYGADYAATIDRLTPSWIVAALIGISVIGGIAGGLLGKRLLKKHFEKAGVA